MISVCEYVYNMLSVGTHHPVPLDILSTRPKLRYSSFWSCYAATTAWRRSRFNCVFVCFKRLCIRTPGTGYVGARVLRPKVLRVYKRSLRQPVRYSSECPRMVQQSKFRCWSCGCSVSDCMFRPPSKKGLRPSCHSPGLHGLHAVWPFWPKARLIKIYLVRSD